VLARSTLLPTWTLAPEQKFGNYGLGTAVRCTMPEGPISALGAKCMTSATAWHIHENSQLDWHTYQGHEVIHSRCIFECFNQSTNFVVGRCN
jgi:hypothetical protein